MFIFHRLQSQTFPAAVWKNYLSASDVKWLICWDRMLFQCFTLTLFYLSKLLIHEGCFNMFSYFVDIATARACLDDYLTMLKQLSSNPTSMYKTHCCRVSPNFLPRGFISRPSHLSSLTTPNGTRLVPNFRPRGRLAALPVAIWKTDLFPSGVKWLSG